MLHRTSLGPLPTSKGRYRETSNIILVSKSLPDRSGGFISLKANMEAANYAGKILFENPMKNLSDIGVLAGDQKSRRHKRIRRLILSHSHL